MSDTTEAVELTEEDIMTNDIDPLDGIRELRKSGNQEMSEDFEDLAAEVDQSKEDAAENLSTNAMDEEVDLNTDGQEDKSADDQEADAKSDAEQEAGTEEGESAGPKMLKYKADGQEFEFTQEEVLEQFGEVFGKAMNYTNKMKAIAPYRKMISALETEGISQDQLNTAIDALKGNKEALAKLMRDHEVDSFDLDAADTDKTPYNPTDYGKTELQQELDEVTQAIAADPESKITINVIGEQWDAQSRAQFANNPQMIKALHNEIKSGLYDEALPEMMKMKVLDGNVKSDIEYYVMASKKVAEAKKAQADREAANSQVQQNNQRTEDAVRNSEQASSEAQRKAAAATTGRRAGSKGVIDYLDDENDENYEAWYKKTMSKI